MWLKVISTLSFLVASHVATASADVTSREYKLMLNTSQFTYGTESSNVYALSQALKNAIQPAIQRSVTGSPSLEKVRTVRFFDTRNSCLLKNSGYAFRERTQNGNSEVTLKFRSPDRYISAFEDMDSNTSGAEEKLEEDIGANAQIPYKVVYGHSTTAPNTRTVNRMNDIHYHFPDFQRDYPYSGSAYLSRVSGLTINERVYKNVMIDLGSIDAEVSITLWYGTSAPSASTRPVVAEVSFKYKDASANYTRKVVNRAKRTFDAMRGLTTWVNPNSMTKTQYVYNYDSSFCS